MELLLFIVFLAIGFFAIGATLFWHNKRMYNKEVADKAHQDARRMADDKAYLDAYRLANEKDAEEAAELTRELYEAIPEAEELKPIPKEYWR